MNNIDAFITFLNKFSARQLSRQRKGTCFDMQTAAGEALRYDSREDKGASVVTSPVGHIATHDHVYNVPRAHHMKSPRILM